MLVVAGDHDDRVWGIRHGDLPRAPSIARVMKNDSIRTSALRESYREGETTRNLKGYDCIVIQ
jgi:hypothetical protein